MSRRSLPKSLHQFHAGPICRLATVALATGLLAACAASDGASSFLVASGKYVLFTCPQIAQQVKENSDRQHQLEGLMAKAGNGAAGRLVSATTYRPEYLQLRGEMADLRETAANRKCNFVPGLAPAAPPASNGPLH